MTASPRHERYQTLDEQERQRMRELLDMLTTAPESAASAPIHEKIGALAELQLLIGAHNANGSRFIRELVAGELDQLRADMHAIHDPLTIIIERVSQRLDSMDARQSTMDKRLTVVELRQQGSLERVEQLERRQDRLEVRTRLNTLLVVIAIVGGFVVTATLHLLLR